MDERAKQNLDTAVAYLRAIELRRQVAESARFLHDDVIVEELPNRLNPAGQRMNLEAIMAAAARGAQAIRDERYEVLNSAASDDTVLLEIAWSGTLQVPFGSLKAGDVMTARIASVFEFRDGRIARQRQYDCFAPF